MLDDFDSYVEVAWPRLLRSAWLLTGDFHKAEDLLQTVLARAYPRWPRMRDQAPDAYLRRMLATTYLSWRRRRWRDEIPTRDLPDRPMSDRYGDIDTQHALAAAVATLPRQQRAVVMLRFHADLSEAATADALGISVGAVKSHTARALRTLRTNPAVRAMMPEEVFS